MFNEIIEKNLNRIQKDLSENIEGLQRIDFIDIFLTSKKHKIELDEELKNTSTLLKNRKRKCI